MEIRQLRYFLKIVEMGSFSRASQRLYIAQSALSYQLAKLESELGHALLFRRHTGITVTTEGQIFYERAQSILKDIDDLPEAIGLGAQQACGTVCLGLPQGTAAQYAMPLLAGMRDKHPKVKLEFFDEICGNLLPGLSTGQLDIAVIENTQDAVRANCTPVMEEELFFVTSAKNEVDQSFPITRLGEVPLIFPGARYGVRALIEEAARALGAAIPAPSILANSMSIVRRTIELGSASSVMPWGAIPDEIRAGTIRAVPLLPKLTQRVHVCSSKGSPLTLAGQVVHEELVKLIRSRVMSREWLGVELV